MRTLASLLGKIVSIVEQCACGISNQSINLIEVEFLLVKKPQCSEWRDFNSNNLHSIKTDVICREILRRKRRRRRRRKKRSFLLLPYQAINIVSAYSHFFFFSHAASYAYVMLLVALPTKLLTSSDDSD